MVTGREIKTADISFHRIQLDLEKSEGSYIFDNITQRKYLDFFGMYSSLPLGYNHPSFLTKEFEQDMIRVSRVKVSNCEMRTPEFNRFVDNFSRFAIPRSFASVHFSCTGALAVEHAIKSCLFHKMRQEKNSNFVSVSFLNSFHGITSYGNFLTDRCGNVKKRLQDCPNIGWPKVDISDLRSLEKILREENVSSVILEPIQCTFGDIVVPVETLNEIRFLTEKYKVPLIFDEVQTGFCSTGNIWFFNSLNWEPDVVVFGKKSQVSGFFIKENFSQIFEEGNAGRVCVTFDGDLTDMVRCHHIINKIKEHEFKILKDVKIFGEKIREQLSLIDGIEKVRGSGVLIGFDLITRGKRDKFVMKLRERGMICNTAGERSIRLRPSLTATDQDREEAVKLITETMYAN